MTTSNSGNNYGNNYGNNWPTTTNNSTSSGTTTSTSSCGTSSATCTSYTCGSTWNVNEITTPGCYVCNWNGSLLRISDASFTSGGFTSFNFTSCDPLTVTYLTDNPTTTVEECRTLAHGANVYCNF